MSKVTIKVDEFDSEEVQEMLSDAGILFWLEGDD